MIGFYESLLLIWKKTKPIFEIKMIWKHWLQMDWITENYSVVLDNLEIHIEYWKLKLIPNFWLGRCLNLTVRLG